MQENKVSRSHDEVHFHFYLLIIAIICHTVVLVVRCQEFLKFGYDH